MPYTTPTATEFKTRHSAFSAVDSDYIDAIIAEAVRYVDTSWFEEDYQPAVMHLTAHMLMCEGAIGGVSTAGVLASQAIGDASESYDNSKPSVSDYQSTTYGRAFLRLLRVNHPGVVAAT